MTESAAAWHDRWTAVHEVEVSPGFRVRLRHLSLTGELFAGTMRNQMLSHCAFDRHTADEQQARDYHKERYEGMIRFLARAMVWPKIRLPIDGAPNYDRGEIAPADLHFLEVELLYGVAIHQTLPPIATCPPGLLELDDDGQVLPGFALDPDALARLAWMAEQQGQRPSTYLDLAGPSHADWRERVGNDVAAYWLWCVDHACRAAAVYVENREQQKADDERAGRVLVMPNKAA